MNIVMHISAEIVDADKEGIYIAIAVDGKKSNDIIKVEWPA